MHLCYVHTAVSLVSTLYSLASHTLQSQERGSGDHVYSLLFRRNAIITKDVKGNRKQREANCIARAPPVKRCQAINSNLESNWTRPNPVARTTRCMHGHQTTFPSDCGVWLARLVSTHGCFTIIILFLVSFHYC